MDLQETLHARVQEIVLKERETQPKGKTVVQSGITWRPQDNAWVVVLNLQDNDDLDYIKFYKFVAL